MIEDNPDIALHMPLLRAIAARSTFVMELGCGDGNGSMRALSQGLRESTAAGEKLMITVELREDRPKYERPPDPWWKLVHGDTADLKTVQAAFAHAWTDADYKLGRGSRLADLIFIDTAHTYQQLARELDLWKLFSRHSTVWLFHDTWMEGVYNPMTAAIDEFVLREGLIFDNTRKDCHGLGVVSNVDGFRAISECLLRF